MHSNGSNVTVVSLNAFLTTSQLVLATPLKSFNRSRLQGVTPFWAAAIAKTRHCGGCHRYV